MNGNKTLFEQYVYHRICDDFNIDGPRKSLEPLCRLARKDIDTVAKMPHQEAVAELLPHIPENYQKKVALVEQAINNRYKIDADCEDDELMLITYNKFKKILQFIPNDSKQNTTTRIGIYEHLYDIDEQRLPTSWNNRFEIVKKSVKDIKHNDGSFDHQPLNIIARQVQYFMKNIPAQKRYALLLEIKKKTIDTKAYDYNRQIKELYFEYKQDLAQQRAERQEFNQIRYEQLREELNKPHTTDDKIALYQELLTVINDQDFSRSRKFNEKKNIYYSLNYLYQQVGNTQEAQKAKEQYDKFLNARDKCREAARLKGYNKSREY